MVAEAIGDRPGKLPRVRVVDLLCSFPGRGAGTDAERRAALAVVDDLGERGHDAWIETHWVRRAWALAVALGALLGAAGSLLSVAAPAAGVALAGVAAACLALEALGRASPLRLPAPRRATQNVLSLPAEPDGVTLVIAAPYDAPLRGLVLNDRWRALGARLRNVRGWLALCALVVAGAAGARLAGVEALWLGVVQLVPTVALIGAFAAALDIALSDVSPGAGTASAAAVALALHDELAQEPPAKLAPALLLYGAGTTGARTLRAQLKRERAQPQTTVLLEIGPCSGGSPAWSSRHPQLRRAAELASEALELAPAGRRPGPPRGPRRIPALRIVCLDARGIAARSHQPNDTAANVDPEAATEALDLALGIVDALDAELAARSARGATATG
jgi:hypothetical protein